MSGAKSAARRRSPLLRPGCPSRHLRCPDGFWPRSVLQARPCAGSSEASPSPPTPRRRTPAPPAPPQLPSAEPPAPCMETQGLSGLVVRAPRPRRGHISVRTTAPRAFLRAPASRRRTTATQTNPGRPRVQPPPAPAARQVSCVPDFSYPLQLARQPRSSPQPPLPPCFQFASAARQRSAGRQTAAAHRSWKAVSLTLRSDGKSCARSRAAGF